MSHITTSSEPAHFEVVDDKPFFAPMASDLLDGLLGQYAAMRQRIEQVVGLFAADLGNVVHYFVEGNKDRGSYSSVSAERICRAEGAVGALNSAFWSKALALTDVLDCMPQKRRDEWNKQIQEQTAPDFTADAVRPTIGALLRSRDQFFAERVDGIFRELSGEHVTNAPEGFGRRMIIAYVLSEYGGVNTARAGVINDLRCVVAKFMGRDEPKWNATCSVLQARGFAAIKADFIAWAADRQRQGQLFNRVVMNPPFSEGRAQAHLQAAADIVAPGGRLVAILPASMTGKHRLGGFDCTWSDVFAGEFAGTNVSVVILTAVKTAS